MTELIKHKVFFTCHERSLRATNSKLGIFVLEVTILRGFLPSYKNANQEIKHILSYLAYVFEVEVTLFLGKIHVIILQNLPK